MKCSSGGSRFPSPRYSIEGLGWEIDGEFMAHDFEIVKNGRKIVTITKSASDE